MYQTFYLNNSLLKFLKEFFSNVYLLNKFIHNYIRNQNKNSNSWVRLAGNSEKYVFPVPHDPVRIKEWSFTAISTAFICSLVMFFKNVLYCVRIRNVPFNLAQPFTAENLVTSRNGVGDKKIYREKIENAVLFSWKYVIKKVIGGFRCI